MAKRTKPVTHKPAKKSARKNRQAKPLPSVSTGNEKPEVAALSRPAPETTETEIVDSQQTATIPEAELIESTADEVVAGSPDVALEVTETPTIAAEDAVQTASPDVADSISNDQPAAEEQPDIAKPAELEYASAEGTPDSAPNHITQDAASSRAAARRRLRKVGLLLAILLIAVVGAIAWRAHSQADPDAATTKLIAEVSQRAVLPTGEKPTVTTIVDKDKVNQSFLQNAHNGDKVLLYFQAGKAVVYRPSTHQIVNIGPLTQPPAQVFLRDGSGKGIPSSLRDKLTQPAGFTVVSQDTSVKATYTKTLVVDITGNRPDIAARVATLTGGHVGPLPAGESRPDADILVITGSDAK